MLKQLFCALIKAPVMKSEILQSEIILENDKVLLIPFENERNIELKSIIFDDEIWKHMGMYVQNDVDFKNYIESTLSQKKYGICYPFLIIDKVTNKVAGSTRYGYLNYVSKKCEIGWTWYGKEFQGTGLNKACKYELLNFGFENIQFRRIQFSADIENEKSQRAIEKLGAIKEGLFRNNYIDSEGKSRDDVYYSIISEDWKTTKSEYFSEF
jgi:RimJ/RimL family protein N-acetyltransferase